MKKKILFITMTVLVASQLVLAGCGKKEPVPEEPVVETPAPEQVAEVEESETTPEVVKEEEPKLPTIKGTLHIEIKEDSSGEQIVDFEGKTIKGIKNREIVLEDEAKTVLSDMGADTLGWRWEDALGNGYYVWACSYDTPDKANFNVDVLAEADYSAALASTNTK